MTAHVPARQGGGAGKCAALSVTLLTSQHDSRRYKGGGVAVYFPVDLAHVPARRVAVEGGGVQSMLVTLLKSQPDKPPLKEVASSNVFLVR